MKSILAIRSLTFALAVGAVALAGCSRGTQLAGPAADAALAARSADAARGGGARLFVTSGHENADGTVTLPLHRGTSKGRTVWYILLDASTGDAAKRWGINESQKLAHLRGTTAAQKVAMVNGMIEFPASVDFSPRRDVVAGPTGFPPAHFEIGAEGEAGYSPFIELTDGTILNAPIVANESGQADKVKRIDTAAGTVDFEETDGFSGGKAVRYVSTDASIKLAAALENVTYAPALDAAPSVGQDGTDQSRTGLIAFVNGQLGAGNPNRQGLNSAVLDGLAPLNILRWAPNQGRYSPIWDVHPAAWTDAAIASGQNKRQTDFGTVQGLVDKGLVTGPGGAKFGAAGFVVNCPIISQR
ncbi:MAG: hypothetical protein ABL977_10605 [Candidatus Eisenbacteria bacterium]